MIPSPLGSQLILVLFAKRRGMRGGSGGGTERAGAPSHLSLIEPTCWVLTCERSHAYAPSSSFPPREASHVPTGRGKGWIRWRKTLQVGASGVPVPAGSTSVLPPPQSSLSTFIHGQASGKEGPARILVCRASVPSRRLGGLSSDRPGLERSPRLRGGRCPRTLATSSTATRRGRLSALSSSRASAP